MMQVSVSEIKTFRTCRRQWLLSSRNRFHLRPRVNPPAFAFGTLFHEALHELYQQVPLEKVLERTKREATADDAALIPMITGYAREVLGDDLDRFKVLDIEHQFAFTPKDRNGEVLVEAEIIGFIDMVVLDIEENAIYGFEHKSCKNFREPTFLWMDEQPRVYTKALEIFVEEYNRRHALEAEEKGVEFRPATVGGIYMNEVKKLLRDFKYQRTLCKYPEDDLDNFMEAFFGSVQACKIAVDTNDFAAPNPSYFTCQMCSYRSVCETYMYSTLNEAQVAAEFAEELYKASTDHTDEKMERPVNE